MNKIPFVNLFSQSSTGLSINGNDLIITVVSKKLVKYSHETLKIEDFMLKDTQQLKHALIQKRNFVGETILSLPRELAIIRETTCPYSNLKELKEALRYQLDSFIPFSSEDVYFDIHSLSQNRHETKVLIVAIKKTELDTILSKLKVLEIIPSRVIISPFAFLPILEERKGSVAVVSKNIKYYSYNVFENNLLVLSSVAKTEVELANQVKSRRSDEILLAPVTNGLLPDEYKTNYKLLEENSESYGAALYGLAEYPCYLSLVKSHRKRLNPQIVLICFLIGFLIFFSFLIPYIQKINNLAILKTVNAHVKLIKKDVVIVEKLQERIIVLDEVVNKANAIRGKYIPRIDVILELAKTLPNDAWVKGITIMDNTFEIEGDAVSSTNLIPILENSSLFSGVGLTSPVTKTQSGREKFRIKGNIEK
ncbi:MAG: PilN domain-containing protein [Planctomycetes bacterium]|uniref:PilN domain-containing protein n=1 Tax=Candidatus Wunengus sp. YC65 TaxID=3367701 RepID=UPI001D559F66|nr:PilN domain-containing protein [Planctomycetota bacterium]